MKFSEFRDWMRRTSKLEVGDVVKGTGMSRSKLIDLRSGVRLATTNDLRHLFENLEREDGLPVHADALREILVEPIRREMALLAHVAGELDRSNSRRKRVAAARRAE